METKIAEIADGIYRLSTFVPEIAPPAGFAFNSFLIKGEQPLLFHTGLRKMFPLNRDAVAKIVPVESLRWIAFGHYEADECGAMNEWMAVAPNAQVAHGATGVMVSLNDTSDRAPRMLADGETIELGGKRVRYIDTPHTPHGWDAGVMFEEKTGTLLSGDLFTQLGDNPPLIHGGDLVGPAMRGEELFQYSALSPGMGSAIRRLAPLKPKTLALMHGPSFQGDGSAALNALADYYDMRAGQRWADMQGANIRQKTA